MPELKHRKEKLQEKRKKTPWRQFVRDVAAWMPMVFYKRDGGVSRFPETGREGELVSVKDFDPDNIVFLDENETSGDFFSDLTKLFQLQPKMTIQQWFENENSDYAELYG